MYARRIGGTEYTFGVSGLLYKSNVLMYDHQTESLWSQVKSEAVAGPMTGTRLSKLPSTLTTWMKWRRRFPDTEVLSMETGYDRNYAYDPYTSYYEQEKGFFSFFRPGPDEEEKALVAGVSIDGQSRAYPLKLLRRRGRIVDRMGGEKLILEFDRDTDELNATLGGKRIEPVILYWFVWKGIHPRTKMYDSPR